MKCWVDVPLLVLEDPAGTFWRKAELFRLDGGARCASAGTAYAPAENEAFATLSLLWIGTPAVVSPVCTVALLKSMQSL